MSATEVVANMPLHSATVRVNKHKADWRGWKFMWPFALVFVFVFVIPILYAIYISFFQKQMIGGTKFVGISNYIRLFHDQQFWSSVGRVALFTCVQVPVMLFLSAAMALALDSMKLHGAKFFRITTFLPYAVPAVVSTLVWGFMYGAKYGLVGSLNDWLGTNLDVLSPNVLLAAIGNIVTWEFTGYNMLIFLAALQAIPHELYEAARIDGASGWQISMRIKLPNVRSAALLSMLLSIVGTIQLFNEPQIMQTADPGISKTYTPMMMAMNTSQGTLTPGGDGPASAVAIVMALIAGVLAMIYALVERKANEQ